MLAQHLVRQGHIEAALFVGCIHYFGQGASIDYPRAMAAYKVGAEGGAALCQWQVGFMYFQGLGVAADFKEARPWIEKAAAQNVPTAVAQLGAMYSNGQGVTPSWRRARELWARAIELGHSKSVTYLQEINEEDIPEVCPGMAIIPSSHVHQNASRH